MADERLAEYVRVLEELERRQRTRYINQLFPDTGPLRRELYPKHLEFFRTGLIARERAFIAGNRVGKTTAGGYETVLHLTGEYPDWWEGRTFDRPVDWWAAGDTSTTTRDIVQHALMGPPGEEGTGLIPQDRIGRVRPKGGGVPDAIDTVRVKHVSGGWSRLAFKSYDQRRRSFQGTSKDGILLDEEPPEDVYDECVIRTMDCNGMILLTFTPLMGMTPLILRYLPGGRLPQ